METGWKQEGRHVGAGSERAYIHTLVVVVRGLKKTPKPPDTICKKRKRERRPLMQQVARTLDLRAACSAECSLLGSITTPPLPQHAQQHESPDADDELLLT